MYNDEIEELLVKFAKWAFEQIGAGFLKKLGEIGAQYTVKEFGSKILVIIRKASSSLREEVEDILNSNVKKSLIALLIAGISIGAISSAAATFAAAPVIASIGGLPLATPLVIAGGTVVITRIIRDASYAIL